MKVIDYDNDRLHSAIRRMKKQINDELFDVDYVVGIVRGGAVPAVYFSHALKKSLVMIHWNSSHPEGNETNLWLPEDVNNGAKILIVDDIFCEDTYNTLLDDWQASVPDELKTDNIRIATLACRECHVNQVDYFDMVISNDSEEFVVFPWESV